VRMGVRASERGQKAASADGGGLQKCSRKANLKERAERKRG